MLLRLAIIVANSEKKFYQVKKTFIIRHFEGKTTEEETKAILEWIETSPENKKRYIDLKKSYVLISVADVEFDKNWHQIQEKLTIKRKKRERMFLIRKFAAVFLVGLGIVSFWYFNGTEDISGNQIILELRNGTRKIIDPAINGNITNKEGIVIGNQQKESITFGFDSIDTKSEELVYNKLYVPYGKRMKIVLTDGSIVHLNAGTTIRFPEVFISGKDRHIYLESGEAFFEVAKDKNHPFIVHSEGMSTTAYGTKFNLSSYGDTPLKQVVLIEGSVGVKQIISNGFSDEVMLVPNEKIVFSKMAKSVKTNVEAINYIMWTEGKLFFKNEKISVIFQKLERHYGVSIQNNYTAIEDNKYNGIFDAKTSIESVLRAFSAHRPFVYKIDNNNIIINP